MDLDSIATNIANEGQKTLGDAENSVPQESIAAETTTAEDRKMSELDAPQTALEVAKDNTSGNGKQKSAEDSTNIKPEVPSATTEDTPMSEVEPVHAEPSPPLTHALEALLGGLDQPPKSAEAATASNVTQNSTTAAGSHDAPVESAQTESGDAVLPKQPETSNSIEVTADHPMTESTEIEKSTEGQSEQLNGVESTADEPREWETDSSPIESSSDDSSSDDSSDEESEDGDNSFKLLTPEEQAKILMEGDGGSDDEGGNKGKGTGGQLRTKNEIPEVVIPKPNVTITEAMPIEELGNVEAIVENIVLVKGKTTGEYRVLESGSVLCLADRSVIGVVSEPLGRVQQPLYSVLFTNAKEIAEAKLEVGTTVFYSEQHSTYVFTQALKAYKGSDASNLHDEEIGDDEMEFSDDEAEAEHKRRVKQAKRGRGGKMQQNGGPGRGGHPLQQQHTPYDTSKGLSYDEADDDGPYKPLPRPAGFADSVGRSEPPEEGAYQGGANANTHSQNRDNFRGRGRGDRGRGRGDRGRGDRGRGRGGFQDRRGGGSGYSLPPQSQPSFSPPLANGQSYSLPFQQPGGGFPNQPPQTGYNNTQYSPQQPQLPAWPQFPPQPPYQQPFDTPNASVTPAAQEMWNTWKNMFSQAPQPSGAFINPAFFNNPQGGAPNTWNPQGQGRGRGRGGS